MKILLASLFPILFISAKDYPVQPIEGFELQKYLGKWYEIARLDHRFERGMEQVTAEYSLRPDGKVKVVNSGFKEGKWQKSVGKAKFATKNDIGFLKVSFFGPFYGAYIIFDLDIENYSYAFVAGPNTKYLWLLARTPQVSDKLLERFKSKAEEFGFNTDNLIFVEHNN